jgi:ferrous iron transport protein B
VCGLAPCAQASVRIVPAAPPKVTTSGAGGEADERRVIERIAQGRRADGSKLFDTPTAAALLVFFTLAMQCLPTLALVRRETGSWKWPLLQLVWMSGLAWSMAFIVRTALVQMGVT